MSVTRWDKGFLSWQVIKTGLRVERGRRKVAVLEPALRVGLTAGGGHRDVTGGDDTGGGGGRNTALVRDQVWWGGTTGPLVVIRGILG